MSKTVWVQRWNLQHRLQHGLLVISMAGLLVTGLAIKYSYMPWAARVYRLSGGFHGNLVTHKVSAVLLVAAAVYHAVYLAVGRRRYGTSRAMVPGPKDAQDAIQHGAWLLGLAARPPEYDRYSYLEKFEYLAIFWGLVVMGLTGTSLWFPTIAGGMVPRWVLDAFRIVHSNEAFVALLSLAFGHFFFAHFHPSVFPSSTVWYSGRIALHHLMEEHPLEYRRLLESGAIPAGAHHPEGHSLRLSGWRRVLGAVELLLYSAVFYWLLVTYLPLLLK